MRKSIKSPLKNYRKEIFCPRETPNFLVLDLWLNKLQVLKQTNKQYPGESAGTSLPGWLIVLDAVVRFRNRLLSREPKGGTK